MPDIDVDFCFERRQEVIDYVRRKYGDDCVVQIVTFGTLAAQRRYPGCRTCDGSALCIGGYDRQDDSTGAEYHD